MAEFTKAQLIWNDALGGPGGSLLAGDLALGFLLWAHGYVMNGGVFHAVEGIEAEFWGDVASGYRYFGFDDVAELLKEARSISESGSDLGLLEAEFDDRYSRLIPDDLVLFERFEACLEKNPSEFASP